MKSYGRWIIVLLWHSLPFWELLNGWYFACIAMVGLVALPYIKVRKLEQYAADLKFQQPLNAEAQGELASLHTAISRWHFLTWGQSGD